MFCLFDIWKQSTTQMAFGKNGHFPFMGKEKFTITLACIDVDSTLVKKLNERNCLTM